MFSSAFTYMVKSPTNRMSILSEIVLLCHVNHKPGSMSFCPCYYKSKGQASPLLHSARFQQEPNKHHYSHTVTVAFRSFCHKGLSYSKIQTRLFRVAASLCDYLDVVVSPPVRSTDCSLSARCQRPAGHSNRKDVSGQR